MSHAGFLLCSAADIALAVGACCRCSPSCCVGEPATAAGVHTLHQVEYARCCCLQLPGGNLPANGHGSGRHGSPADSAAEGMDEAAQPFPQEKSSCCGVALAGICATVTLIGWAFEMKPGKCLSGSASTVMQAAIHVHGLVHGVYREAIHRKYTQTQSQSTSLTSR